MTWRDVQLEASRQFDAAAERGRVELEQADRDRIERELTDVWIAAGLRKRWRVIAVDRSFGEWDDLTAATQFLALLVDGNPNLRRLA
ncbi:MAG TPA: hypothetical protein VGN14_14315 [Candidatus Elarobacter sp.]